MKKSFQQIVFKLSSLLALSVFCSAGLSATASEMGTMTVVGTPSGVSGYVTANIGANPVPIIYGGLVSDVQGTYSGSGACANPDGVNTCNSCLGNGLVACNPKSIYPTLSLNITLISSSAAPFSYNGVAVTPVVYFKMSGITSAVLLQIPVQPAGVVQNTPFTVSIPWSSICAAATAGTDQSCTTSFSQAMTIGLENDGTQTTLQDSVVINVTMNALVGAGVYDTNTSCPEGAAVSSGTGICDFSLAHGDSKVYVDSFQASDSHLTTGLTDDFFSNIVMFYKKVPADGSADSISEITNASPSATLALVNNKNSAPGLADARIENLQNGSRYCFVLGNQDQTGNIYYFNTGATTPQCSTPGKY